MAWPLQREEAVDIRSGQRLAWENKTGKDFNTTDAPLEFCLLQGEVAEAFDAWRKGRENLGEDYPARRGRRMGCSAARS